MQPTQVPATLTVQERQQGAAQRSVRKAAHPAQCSGCIAGHSCRKEQLSARIESAPASCLPGRCSCADHGHLHHLEHAAGASPSRRQISSNTRQQTYQEQHAPGTIWLFCSASTRVLLQTHLHHNHVLQHAADAASWQQLLIRHDLCIYGDHWRQRLHPACQTGNASGTRAQHCGAVGTACPLPILGQVGVAGIPANMSPCCLRPVPGPTRSTCRRARPLLQQHTEGQAELISRLQLEGNTCQDSLCCLGQQSAPCC